MTNKFKSKIQIKKSNFFISIILFLFSFLVMFVLAEIIISTIKPPLKKIESVSDFVQFNIHYGLEPKPNIEYKEYGYKVKVNSKAVYGDEISKEKNGLRIAYLGDSYSVGPGIDFKKNYPYLINKKIQSRHPKADFLIGGIGGSSPFQQKFIYQTKIASYKPDIVVYELFDNDIGDDYIFRYSQYFARIQVYNAVPNFLRNSKLVQQLMILAMNQLESYYKYKYETTKHIMAKNPDEIWKKYTEPAMNQMLQLSREQKSKFIVIYIPSGWTFNDEYTAGPTHDKKYILEKASADWARRHGIPYTNMRSILSKYNTTGLNELYLPGDKGYHLTTLGASLVADKTYDLIVDKQ